MTPVAAMGVAAALFTGALGVGASPRALEPDALGWSTSGLGAVRGVTLGPIENARHPGVGYGTAASERAIDEAARMGARWISLTPFGRVWDLKPSGVDPTFEADFEDNRAAVRRAIAQAHARGLAVFLVPHLWVETGGWRALIEPGDDAAWSRFTDSYGRFLLAWADVARDADVEMLSVGVELRSWVTTPRAHSMLSLIERVRRVYPGLLTYSANWDDVGDSLVLTDLDVIGVNAFFPLAEHEGATADELLAGGRRVEEQLERVARTFGKPVLLTEMGYTTRRDPALRPWEWPDEMKNVVVDERAQAEAYRALLAPLTDAPWCAGFFAWRLYADPDDVSQEAEWGFSPRGKLAELALRDAFTVRWASDGPSFAGDDLGRHAARTPGVFAWELDPGSADQRMRARK